MKVDQYHEEGGGKRTVINLGVFSEEEHLAWLEKHSAKRPKEGEARKQVSVFYSGGDVCDLTGKPRQIEVKLKCKAADSPSTVTLYLLEPKVFIYYDTFIFFVNVEKTLLDTRHKIMTINDL